MGRRPRGSSASRARGEKLLARLDSAESAGVLRALLQRHPELVAEAGDIARAAVAGVDADAVAEEVEQAVLTIDEDDLGARSGRHAWGYVEPSEAAWELLQEAVEPFLEEVKRLVDLGFEAAAGETCAGIVLGLYRCRGKRGDQALAWAEDFPEEAACQAADTLARRSREKHRRAWRLPEAFGPRVPEWTGMIRRAAQPASRGR